MKRIHISWIICILSVGILIGIGLAAFSPAYISGSVWAVAAGGLLSVGVFSRRKASLPLIIFAGVIIGCLRGGAAQADLTAYDDFLKQEVVLSGVVGEDPAFSNEGEQRLKLKNIKIAQSSLPGQVWVSTSSNLDIKRSDQVVFEGRLEDGFGSFAASVYRARLIEAARPLNADIARDVRDKFAQATQKVVGEPEASLGIGFLAGKRTSLPEDLSEQLKILGLTHIVVASGYNLSILVRFARRLFSSVSKYLSFLISLLLTFSMIAVTGLSPSMTRAGLITTLCLIAWYFGRAIHPIVLLSFAAAVTCFVNPAYLWGDLGWYLSFAAFGGVIVLSPLLIHYFWGASRPNSLLQILVETTSAQLVTMPIIAVAFGQYAPLATLSNLLILPFVPLAMAATFVAGIGGLVIENSGSWVGWPSEIVLGYMIAVVNWLAQIPIAVAEVSFSLPMLVGSYILICLMIFYLYRKTNHNFDDDNIVK